MSEELCGVCGEAMDENRASCNQCGNEFHLALRIDRPARDCGEAWIDEDVQALVFGCNTCLGRGQPAEKQRRVRHTGVKASAVARARRQRRER
jgi:predicted amidophosphoribosyltransferase